jgi:hypothetical protein
VDEQAAERVAVLNDVDIPAVLARRGKQLIARETDIASTETGEEVQVLGRARRQTLRQQRPPPAIKNPSLAGSRRTAAPPAAETRSNDRRPR